MPYQVRDRNNHAAGVHFNHNWGGGTCAFGHDVTLEANISLESRANRKPGFLMRCMVCKRASSAERLAAALRQDRWANAVKTCGTCGDDFRPADRDITDPTSWAARKYCSRACSSRAAKTGPTFEPVVTLPPMPRDSWQNRASCDEGNGANLAEFYPGSAHVQGEAVAQAEAETARRYCARCPVRRDCLITALHRKETYGVWGGTTPKQRAAMLKTGLGIPA